MYFHVIFCLTDSEYEQHNHFSVGQFAEGRSERSKRGMFIFLFIIKIIVGTVANVIFLSYLM